MFKRFTVFLFVFFVCVVFLQAADASKSIESSAKNDSATKTSNDLLTEFKATPCQDIETKLICSRRQEKEAIEHLKKLKKMQELYAAKQAKIVKPAKISVKPQEEDKEIIVPLIEEEKTADIPADQNIQAESEPKEESNNIQEETAFAQNQTSVLQQEQDSNSDSQVCDYAGRLFTGKPCQYCINKVPRSQNDCDFCCNSFGWPLVQDPIYIEASLEGKSVGCYCKFGNKIYRF